jgi:hypothetical protein
MYSPCVLFSAFFLRRALLKQSLSMAKASLPLLIVLDFSCAGTF